MERSVGRLRDGLEDHLPTPGPPVHRHQHRAARRSQAWRPSPLARQTRAVLAILAGAILVFSFEEADNPGFPITVLTTRWYEVMLADSAIHTALLNSIEVAVAVALLESG